MEKRITLELLQAARAYRVRAASCSAASAYILARIPC